MAWIGGAIVPIIAAAAVAREEEDELMSTLREEAGDGWEFKIVRSVSFAFGNPHRLRQMLEEEVRAGWVLAGKLDDSRVFLKRPRSARELDHLLEPGINPYRTDYGIAAVTIGLLMVGILTLLMALFLVGMLVIR